jgi:hypothetical protein
LRVRLIGISTVEVIVQSPEREREKCRITCGAHPVGGN